MMRYCEDLAREHQKSSIYCHARDTAVNFYLNNGYVGEGDYFDEDGIPHWKMTKLVSP
ncbi:MAG: GNAT family N-acetyltransferase [Bacteroidetes bacterium]|nr:MAG: GNAT family N-acetyltransferase [Bacteroidota bacterium]